ncbi:MAG: carbamoyltransferase, partial [Fuerstiella sp.]|nr:carbamoyltransferase [Fuerstiella sp.]
MNIIGINAYHGDASAAVVVDGQLIAAVEEERLNRIKHWAGFPSQSIRYCLDAAGIEISDVDHIAVSFNPRANLMKRLAFVATHRPGVRAIIDRLK